MQESQNKILQLVHSIKCPYFFDLTSFYRLTFSISSRRDPLRNCEILWIINWVLWYCLFCAWTKCIISRFLCAIYGGNQQRMFWQTIVKKGLLLFNASFGEHLCIIDNTGMILQNCQKKKKNYSKTPIAKPFKGPCALFTYQLWISRQFFHDTDLKNLLSV